MALTASPEPKVWKKSSACTGTATCVEYSALPDGGAAIRDGKDPQGPELHFTATEWAAFLSGARAGEFGPGATA